MEELQIQQFSAYYSEKIKVLKTSGEILRRQSCDLHSSQKFISNLEFMEIGSHHEIAKVLLEVIVVNYYYDL